MEGGEDPDNRRDFPARAFAASGRRAKEEEMFEWTRAWIRLRREHSALRSGRLIDLFSDDDVYVFARQDSAETVVIGINRSDKPVEVTIPFKSLTFLLGEVRADTFQSKVTLPANSAVAFKTS